MIHDETRTTVPPGKGVIKSYVLRKGRMSPAQRKAYETFSPAFCIPYRESELEFSSVFPGFTDIVTEIGFGMGEATAAIALANPGTAYLGLEVHTPGVGKLLHRIQFSGITNIRIVEHDAVEVFNAMIPDGSLAGIHIFFPDPWPKKRHHKRRLIRDDSVGTFIRALRPGGYLHVATDWEEYAVQVLGVLGRAPGIRNTAPGFAGRPDRRPETAFERKGTAKGRRIYEIIFTKTSANS